MRSLLSRSSSFTRRLMYSIKSDSCSLFSLRVLGRICAHRCGHTQPRRKRLHYRGWPCEPTPHPARPTRAPQVATDDDIKLIDAPDERTTHHPRNHATVAEISAPLAQDLPARIMQRATAHRVGIGFACDACR